MRPMEARENDAARRSGRRAAAACAALAAFGLSACSVLRSSYQDLTVQASEEGATIYVNDQEVGPSPVTVPVRRNRDVVVRVRKPGFEDSTRTVDVHWNTTAVLDAIGGVLILVPALGLFAPGAWDLD